MKNLTIKSLMLTALAMMAVSLMSVSLTSCSDDDNESGVKSPYKMWRIDNPGEIFEDGEFSDVILDATNKTTMTMIVKPGAATDLDQDLYLKYAEVPYSITMDKDGTSGKIIIGKTIFTFTNLTGSKVEVTFPGEKQVVVKATAVTSPIEVTEGSFIDTNGTRRVIMSSGYYFDEGLNGYNLVLSTKKETFAADTKPEGEFFTIDFGDAVEGEAKDITQNLSTPEWLFYVTDANGKYWNSDFQSGTIEIDIDEMLGTSKIFLVKLNAKLQNGKSISVKYIGYPQKVNNIIYSNTGL